jgi:hypothetical protein
MTFFYVPLQLSNYSGQKFVPSLAGKAKELEYSGYVMTMALPLDSFPT